MRIRLTLLPADKNFSFKTAEAKEIVDENIMKNKLFYLTFKTSDADTVTRYVYGDIYYAVNKDGKETGSNYRIQDDAFKQAEESIKDCTNEIISRFRAGFKKQKENIEKILNYNSEYNAIFLHFDFEDRTCKYWYNKEELNEIDKLLICHFFKEEDKKLVSNSMLYRTICTGKEKNDIQFPSFDIKNRYKTRL